MDSAAFFPHDRALMAIVPQRLAQAWARFEVEDSVLMLYAASAFNTDDCSVWIMSLSGRGGWRELLRQTGWHLEQGFPLRSFIFRTEIPVVEKWARRFSSQLTERYGHRTRYYSNSDEFFDLARKAYALRRVAL